MVQGRVLVQEALRSGIRVRFILRREGDAFRAADDGIPTLDVDASVFDAINDTTSPQGVLAVCDMPGARELSDEGGWLLIAHGISDPGNLGTIMRSAEAAGAAAVVVSRGTADPYSPKCVRSAAGATFKVPIIPVVDLSDENLTNVELVGTTSHGGPGVESLWDADLSGRVGIVLGSEAHGLADSEPIRRWVCIPHSGRTESLNVAMAATVIAMHIGHVRG